VCWARLVWLTILNISVKMVLRGGVTERRKNQIGRGGELRIMHYITVSVFNDQWSVFGDDNLIFLSPDFGLGGATPTTFCFQRALTPGSTRRSRRRRCGCPAASRAWAAPPAMSLARQNLGIAYMEQNAVLTCVERDLLHCRKTQFKRPHRT